MSATAWIEKRLRRPILSKRSDRSLQIKDPNLIGIGGCRAQQAYLSHHGTQKDGDMLKLLLRFLLVNMIRNVMIEAEK
jgi:hypothetical protein